jgi:hypothetical protein
MYSVTKKANKVSEYYFISFDEVVFHLNQHKKAKVGINSVYVQQDLKEMST